MEFNEQHSLIGSFIDRLLYPGPYVVAQVAVTPGGDGEAGALTMVRPKLAQSGITAPDRNR